MKRFLHLTTTFIASLTLVLGLTLSPLTVVHAGNTLPAANPGEKELCQGSGGTWTDPNGPCVTPGLSVMGLIRTIGNLLIFLVGAVAVLMLIIGSFKYAASQGDQNSLTGAKNTIIYALVGIVLAVASFAIVNFVIDQLEKGRAAEAKLKQESQNQ